MDLTAAVLVALANALIPHGVARVDNVTDAKTLMRLVFTGKDTTLKIMAIKFVREQTGMSLVDSKNLVMTEIFGGHQRVFSKGLIESIQRDQNLPSRYF